MRRPLPSRSTRRSTGQVAVAAALLLVAILITPIGPSAAVLIGTTELIDITTADPISPVHPAQAMTISGDGSAVAFYARPSAAPPGCTTTCWYAWVRDLATGDTERIAMAWRQSDAEGSSDWSAELQTGIDISGDGRFVAFHSFDDSLVIGDTNERSDVFVYDSDDLSIERASYRLDGTQFARGSYLPSISDDGRRVVFTNDEYIWQAPCTDCEFGDLLNDDDIFLRDLDASATSVVSLATGDGMQDEARYGRISGDGLWATFASGSPIQAYRRNLTTNALDLVSKDDSDEPASSDVFPIVIPSDDGSTVLFQASAPNIVGGGGQALVLVMPSTGELEVLPTPVGFEMGRSSLSGDGSVVATMLSDTAVGGGDEQVFVHDVATGVNTQVSVSSSGEPANDVSYGGFFTDTISDDGRFVIFDSLATNLDPSATSGGWMPYLHDRAAIEVDAPTAPTDVVGVPGDEQVVVSWTAPLDDGGVPILDYTVTASPGGAEVVVDGDQTSAVVGGLVNGIAYTFTVVARNAAGDGPASAPSVAATPRTVPGAPTDVEVFASDGGLRVTWVAPVDDGGASISSHEVSVSGVGAPIHVDAPATGVFYAVVPNGVPVSVTVRAVNVAGAGPSSAPAVEATPHTCADPLLFTDVTGTHPFCTDIEWLIWGGVTTGFPDGTFKPAAGLSRQALATFLYRHAGSPDGSDPVCSVAPFPDVGFSHAFCGEIEWASDEGLLGAYADGGFHPGAAVTRQSLAAVFYRAAGSPDGPDPSCTTAPFTDVPVGHAFCGEIAWAADAGVTGGYADGGFHPGAAVTRQAFAAQLHRSDDLAHGITS